MTHPGYIHDLAIVLGVAAATGILFRLLKQPSVLGYLLAGLIVGPFIPIPLFADAHRVHALSELGVVLVMFVIGLEFRLVKLIRVLPLAGFTALIQIGTLMWAGFALGMGFGWTRLEALFLGASIAISSTMLVSKVFEDRPVGRDVRSLVLGVLVLQDVAAIALIGAVTAIGESGSVSARGLAVTAGRLAITLLIFVAGGMLIVPRLMRAVSNLKNKEALAVTSIGVCFCFALLAETQGYSVALGAFVAGLLVAESSRGHEIEHLIHPIKDMFAAIFFVSIGMTVDPLLAVAGILPALAVFAVVVLAQLASVSIGGLLSGNGLRTSMTAGLALGQIGEFAFIIAGIGVAAGVVGQSLHTLLVTVAVLSAFTTPLALRFSTRIVTYVDDSMPRRLKNILVVYESWLERLRTAKADSASVTPVRKAIKAIVLDAVLWIAILALVAFWLQEILSWLGGNLGVPQPWRKPVLFGAMVFLSVPPLWGVMRNSHLLVMHLTESLVAIRSRSGGKMSEIGSRFLGSAIRLIVVLGVGVPAAALLRNLLGTLPVILLLVSAVLVASTILWRSAGRFDAQIRSEAERFVDFLAGQTLENHAPPPATPFFPDIENMVGIEVEEGVACVGKSLTELNLRALTGALIVTIHRDGADIAIPKGSERVRAGDLLMVTGTVAAIERARKIIQEVAS